MQYIYEIVDCTNDETYFTHGVFGTLEEAVEKVATCPCYIDNDTSICMNEVRRRQLNVLTDALGTTVYRVVWEKDYDACKWLITEQEEW